MNKDEKKNFMTGKHWLIVIVALFAAYQIYNGLSDLTASENQTEMWSNEDRTLLVNKCISETGTNGQLYPEITKVYCECSHNKIFEQFTKSEYLKLIDKPVEEQIRITKPIFQNCLTEYQAAIKLLESNEWTDREFAVMVDKCVQNSGKNGTTYPELTRTYCECSRKVLLNEFSKGEFAEFIKMPAKEQDSISTLLVYDCTLEFQSAIARSEE